MSILVCYVKLLDLVVDVDVGFDVGVNVGLLIVFIRVFFNILYYTGSILIINLNFCPSKPLFWYTIYI